jgi:NAD(P)-dependent dehydrogenase (short-subunit alcohol dehydrogenase family)
MDFTGRSVLITGSTRGIGAAAAARFLAAGAEVTLHGRDPHQVDATMERLARQHPGRVRGLAADLADRGQCRALAEKAGALDVLVNCAGVFREASVAETRLSIWDETIAVNLTAPWVLAQALAPRLKQRKGVIVNVASDAGLLGYANCAAYCAAKGALVGLTRALALELAPEVRVLCVCPGPTETDMMRASIATANDPEAARKHWASYTLLNRVAAPEEIAASILLAASAEASFATGSLVMADGGATAGKRV